MNFAGEITVAAPRDAVFAAISDPPFFAACVEGVSGVTETTPNQYAAVLETRVAYIRFRFEVDVEVTEMEAPRRIRARITGKPHGMVGRISATSETELHEDAGGTRIAYAVEVSLAGRLGSLGQPVLRAKAKDMEAKFTERLRAAFVMQEAPT